MILLNDEYSITSTFKPETGKRKEETGKRRQEKKEEQEGKKWESKKVGMSQSLRPLVASDAAEIG